MTVQEVCKKIFELALPIANAAEAPIAAIHVGITPQCPFSEQELYDAFEEVRWDTELSSADLQIIHKDGDYAVRVLSIELFEEEEIMENSLKVSCGVIL